MVLAIPLLTAAHRDTVKLHAVVVVDCPTDVALERLLTQRGFDRADAEARMRSQVSREERLKEADFVVDNSGDRVQLDARGRTALGLAGGGPGRATGPRLTDARPVTPHR